MLDLSLFRPHRFVYIFFLVFTTIFVLWPYIEAEYYTKNFSNLINPTSVCTENFTNINLKFTKIIKLERYRGFAKIFCFSFDPLKSVEAEIVERQKGWQVVFSEKLNKNRNFYWPMYVN
jgi:hypothetical protein